MRRATQAEARHWDELVLANPDGGHILHTKAWSEFKSAWDWEPHFFVDDEYGKDGAPLAMVFFRRHIAGFGDLWYAPKGPSVTSLPDLEAVLRDRAPFAGSFLVKVEPELLRDDVGPEQLADTSLRPATADVQIYGATVVVDISPAEDALLASFKSKTRYNIRLAAKKGVQVHHAKLTPATLDVMYRLMVATGERAGFPLRQRAYFEDYWSAQAAAGQGDVFFAMLGDEVLSGAFVQTLGHRAWYKDGGSTKRHSALMAPHLLQWEIMRWLKARGITSYDLVAVPRRDVLNEQHPLWGLYRFKSGFSEHITEYVGTLDVPLSSARYAAWNRFGERGAAWCATRLQHNLLY